MTRTKLTCELKDGSKIELEVIIDNLSAGLQSVVSEFLDGGRTNHFGILESTATLTIRGQDDDVFKLLESLSKKSTN